MTTDSAGSGLVRQRTLRWFRRRYEEVEARLSSTWPAPGGATLQDSSAHQRWVKDNVALFAEESRLLREIAVRTADVAAGAHHGADIESAVAGIFPVIRKEGMTLPGSLVEKLAIYGESYAEPDQPLADVLGASVSPGTTRYWELASLAKDFGVLLDATAEAEQWLYALASRGVDPDAPHLASGPPTFQEYVAHGIFAAYGRRTQGRASSLDDHYIGVFGDDWGSGEPLYGIGPSGTDEEHYAELYQYLLWLTARGLRALEAGGQKAIPHGTAQVDVDRRLTAEFGPWMLDRDDPAIRAAVALEDPELAAILFNTPNTQWVLVIERIELRRMGLDGSLAAAKVAEAGLREGAKPWVPGNVASLLAAARPQEMSAELVTQARSATAADLLVWVKQAQFPRPARPEGLSWVIARYNAEDLKREHGEQLLVLKGLRRELETTGPRWWPGTRQRRKELQRRIAERAQVLEQLDTEIDRADDALRHATSQYKADRDVWDASHGAVVSRGIAAVHELQRREDELLDGYLRDPPKDLLEAIGAPPPDTDGRQAWQEQARQVERARVGGGALELAAPTNISRDEPNPARDLRPGGDEGSAAAIDLPQ